MEQMAHLSLLHANQAVVPAATPALGFEHLTSHSRIKHLDQKLHKLTAKKPGKPAEKLTYLHRNLSLSKLFMLLASISRIESGKFS